MSKLSDDDLNYSLVVGGAVRYALGRRSYVVEATVDYVLAHLDELRGGTKATMIRDIDGCHDLGHQTDIENWQRLREALSNSLGVGV